MIPPLRVAILLLSLGKAFKSLKSVANATQTVAVSAAGGTICCVESGPDRPFPLGYREHPRRFGYHQPCAPQRSTIESSQQNHRNKGNGSFMPFWDSSLSRSVSLGLPSATTTTTTRRTTIRCVPQSTTTALFQAHHPGFLILLQHTTTTTF